MKYLPLYIVLGIGLLALLGGAGVFVFALFVVHPADLEGQIELTLPQAGAIVEVDDVDAEAKVVVLVAADQRGAIGKIALQTPDGKTDVPIKDWHQRLVAEMKKAHDKVRTHSVKIHGENRLKWACIVEVMDACKEAEFTTVSFAPPPDDEVKP